MKSSFHTLSLLALLLAALACSCAGSGSGEPQEQENAEAKRMLQGVWLGEDESVMLRVKGDTILYADSTLSPVAFAVIGDSLVVRGYSEKRYAIVKQTPHLFVYTGADGDIVRLMKSDDKADAALFRRSAPLNQRRLIRRDTIVSLGAERYRIYTQVNPSTYKVVRTMMNADGVLSDNVYYDNIINVCIYHGARRLFSRDFHKRDFRRWVPAEYLAQSVLSDITVSQPSATALVMEATLCVPDTPTSYIVDILVTQRGRMSMRGK